MLHPRESGPLVDQGPDVVIKSSTWLGPVLLPNQKNHQKLLKIARYFPSVWGCCRASLSRNGEFENEWIIK